MDFSRLDFTFVAEGTGEVDVATLAHGSRVGVDAHAAVLARVLLQTLVLLVDAHSLHRTQTRRQYWSEPDETYNGLEKIAPSPPI